jgi:predicted O-methyltransferase YrrM
VHKDEPATERAAHDWVAQRVRGADPLLELYAATERHRVQHGCEAYASGDAPLLGVLARAVAARRILEIGTALGYSAAWLAHGAPDARIDTLEADSAHAELAAAELVRVGLSERVTIHVGRSPDALATLAPGYDLVFYDAHVPTLAELARFRELLRPGGLLVTSNLFLGQYDPDMPGLEEGARYREQLFDSDQWLTTFAGLKALSVRV